MNNSETGSRGQIIYYRLVALWVACEAMLGGIVHGLRIPVSGLVVGSCAVGCICLIAWFVPQKGMIIKATLIVAIFKMMLSPQAPVPAYFAVFFQGLLGELLFLNRKLYRLSCLVLASLALLESGLQRIIALTILYGNDLWRAINESLNNLSGQRELTDYSLIIIAAYVILHIIAGILVGWWAGFMPARIKNLQAVREKYNIADMTGQQMNTESRRVKKRSGRILFIIWIILLLLYAQSFFSIGKPILPSSVTLRIMIRSFIIVLTWIFIAGPLLKIMLNKWLQKKKTQSQQEVEQVLQLLPATRQLISKSWQLASARKGLSRVWLCCSIILANTFHTDGN